MAHKWNYETVGGNTRVSIKTAEDIRHLGELDEKKWTILSCPTKGLEIPSETLELMDTDHDGKIRVHEVITTGQWLCSVLAKADALLEEKDILTLDELNPDHEEAVQMASLIRSMGVESVDLATVLAAKSTAAGTIPAAKQQPMPECPVDGGILAAYQANKEAYNAYFEAARLEKIGLGKTDPETAPAIQEKDWRALSEKIEAYETALAAATAANTAAQAAVDAAIIAITAQYEPLIKLLRLKKSFYTLLKNYVTLSDFYRLESKAIFQCGRLVIDQRECELCVRVEDAAAMGAQAGASCMFLLFCDCENKPTGKKMSIVAAMTAGDVRNLSVGKNAVFYDRNGLDYDARVTKIIDNPISISQAFWTPYKKFADWVGDLINKSIAEKENKGFEEMKTGATLATEQAKANVEEGKQDAVPAFDIAKFAGIFAAFGMAIGAIGTMLVSVGNGFAQMSWWQVVLVIIGILLVISGPSMLMAYFKLRKRNLAPILNANGWAVNAEAIVNVPFGNTLTRLAVFPIVAMKDPFAEKKMPTWAKWAIVIAVVAAIAAAAICWFSFFADNGGTTNLLSAE